MESPIVGDFKMADNSFFTLSSGGNQVQADLSCSSPSGSAGSVSL